MTDRQKYMIRWQAAHPNYMREWYKRHQTAYKAHLKQQRSYMRLHPDKYAIHLKKMSNKRKYGVYALGT